MKKILSVLLSIVMLASVSAVAVNAFAVVESQQTTKTSSKITVEVNGSTTKDVTYTENPEKNEITFTYNGSGTLEGWEFDGMIEGEDYEIISEDGNSITIRLLNGYDGDIDANAVVKDKGKGGKKSPKTGAATATGLAAAGAGAAILLALRKKEDAE
ncbi:MAG: hypothetical protein E7570_07530 [Ruminococcaceae bacterium]|nr:hypothetical protein [Oscillospiraceae bacterium]